MNIFDMFSDFPARLFKALRLLRRPRAKHGDAEALVQQAFQDLLIYIEKEEKVARNEALLVPSALNRSPDPSGHEHQHVFDEGTLEELPMAAPPAKHEYEVVRTHYLECLKTSLDEMVGKRAREVFYLKCFGELAHEEIAEQLSISVTDVTTDIAKVLCVLTLMKQDMRPD